jgi:F-type H+-transporting ATPase subunit epsilon
MAEKKTFLLEIVTPERKVFSGNVDFAVIPGSEGEFGVLPNHAAILSGLGIGEVRVRTGEKTDYYAVSGGFAEVRDNKASVLADTAEPAAEIDVARATAAKEPAEAALAKAKDKAEYNRAQVSVKKALLRIKVARRASTGAQPKA